MLSENSSDLYNTVGNTGSVWGYKKKSLVLPSGFSNFFRVEGAGWVLLGCLGEVLKLMELTGKMQELEDSWCTTGFRLKFCEMDKVS